MAEALGASGKLDLGVGPRQTMFRRSLGALGSEDFGRYSRSRILTLLEGIEDLGYSKIERASRGVLAVQNPFQNNLFQFSMKARKRIVIVCEKRNCEEGECY